MKHELSFGPMPVVDIETMPDDLRTVIDVRGFSHKLLSLTRFVQEDFIDDIHAIQELRGTWFERVGLSAGKESLVDFVKAAMRHVASKWGLSYSTD